MSHHHFVAVSVLVASFFASSCREIKPQIDTVNGDGDTRVENVEVGSVGGDGTTQVENVNAQINVGGLLGNPYTIVKTSQPVACADEQSCRCSLVPQRVGILAPKQNVFYVGRMNTARTIFACIMNSRFMNDANKYSVNISLINGATTAATPMGSAKTLEEVNKLFK
jgi:hypothetical protein